MPLSRIGIAILLILTTVGVLTLIGLYETGYRFSGLTLLRPSVIAFEGLAQDARIHVDGKELAETPREDGTFSFKASAESHDIIVTRPGYWPWEKEVLPLSAGTLTLRPILLPSEPRATTLTQSDPKRSRAVSAIRAQKLPTASAPLRAPDGSVILFMRESELIAKPAGEEVPPYFCTVEGCMPERVILTFDAEVRDIGFLPERPDIALIASQNALFAVELDSRGIQNFQPLYKGTRPRFTVIENTLYVEDGALVFTLALE